MKKCTIMIPLADNVGKRFQAEKTESSLISELLKLADALDFNDDVPFIAKLSDGVPCLHSTKDIEQ